MTKPQDLAEYIKTKKPLFAELSKRELANKTKHSDSTCLRALRILKDEGFGPFGPKDQIIKKARIPPRIEKDYIDDPNELLMSVAIRELNRATPDPRWATILINCKKENITNKNLVLEQFKQLPTKALISLLSKNLQIEP